MLHTAPECGGVLHLPDALANHPGAGCVLYTRSSTWGGAGPRKSKLTMTASAVALAIEQLTGESPDEWFFGVEGGSVYERRILLERAADRTMRLGGILVTPDLSRFIRPAASFRIDYRTGRQARSELQPTAEEFTKLHELTHGVPLATLFSPLLTESERHSAATKLRGIAGYPKGRKRL